MSTDASPATEYPQAQQAARIAEATMEVVQAYTIDSPEMYQAAGDELRTIATKAKQLEESRLSITRPMDQAKARVMELFKAPLERLRQAEDLLRGRMLEYKREQDRIAEEARREAERKAQAERERLAREAAAAEEAARQARAAAAAVADEAERQRLELEAAEAEEHAAEVAEAVEVAEVAPPPMPVATVAAKADGVSSRQTWKAEVTSLAELVKAAAKALEAGDDTLLAYLLPNTTALGQVAKALKGQARIPGVRVYAEESLAVRRK